jgi:protein-L-isoaspartate(D-aspartate) O-methyltransferase
MGQYPTMATLPEVKRFYAKLMAAASGSTDPRLERIFELVPREAFLPPGPWRVMLNHRYFETPSADPIFLYQNTLVALDAEKGINNGEPFLHAAWIGKAAPQPGEAITHVGAGTGYYTAILAMLVLPKGRVHGFEIDKNLAARARSNLRPFENAKVTRGDAVARKLPPSDLIYVNAGVVAPPVQWLNALRPNGRMVFPWRPSEKIGLAVLVTRTTAGFSCEPFMASWFIPCFGASESGPRDKFPTPSQARRTRSVWLKADKTPDDTATAIFTDVWFSWAAIPDKPA